MSEAISALNVMLSVSASPSVMLPSAVILPVAWMFPSTLTSESISTVPVPCGRSSRFAFDSLVLTTFPSIVMLSIIALFWYTTLSNVPSVNLVWFVLIVFPTILILAISASL